MVQSPPNTIPKDVLIISDAKQSNSLRHPARKEILKSLTLGKEDFMIDSSREEKHLDNGTTITQILEVKKPTFRFWMTVPEIMENIKILNPNSTLTSRQCYYNLHILKEHGLIHQYPEQPLSKDRPKRIRGLYFRTVARLFLFDLPELSLIMLEKAYNKKFPASERTQLSNLISSKNGKLDTTIEKLVVMMKTIHLDYDTAHLLLIRLAHIYLSEDDEFIQNLRKVRKILTETIGQSFE